MHTSVISRAKQLPRDAAGRLPELMVGHAPLPSDWKLPGCQTIGSPHSSSPSRRPRTTEPGTNRTGEARLTPPHPAGTFLGATVGRSWSASKRYGQPAYSIGPTSSISIETISGSSSRTRWLSGLGTAFASGFSTLARLMHLGVRSSRRWPMLARAGVDVRAFNPPRSPLRAAEAPGEAVRPAGILAVRVVASTPTPAQRYRLDR